MRWKDEILFIDDVLRTQETDAAVNGLGGLVVTFDVEPDAADTGICSDHLDDPFVHPTIDATPAIGGIDIDTLNPPEDGVAPVAPFECDHQLSNQAGLRTALILRNHEKSSIGSVEHGSRAVQKAWTVKRSALGLKRHGHAEGDD